MRTVGYIPEEGAEQKKEPVTEQTGTPATPEPKADETGTPATPEPPTDTSGTTPPDPKTGGTGKKGGKKEQAINDTL